MRLRHGRQTPRCLASLLFLLFLTAVSPSAFAEFQVPEKPDGYVTDRAGLLSPASRTQMENVLRQYEVETSNQIVVAIFPSLEGGALEDTSIRIAQKWRIGQKGRDNGVLFLVFKDDRQMRIEVGYGLEGVLTDLLSSQIIRNDVVPHFRAGDYEKGIFEGVRAIMDAARGEYQAMENRQAYANSDEALLKLILFFIGIFFAVDLIRYGLYCRSHSDKIHRYRFWEWFFLFASLWFVLRILIMSAGRSGGRGWSSGGGFSGGGGSFGGGGASGRW